MNNGHDLFMTYFHFLLTPKSSLCSIRYAEHSILPNTSRPRHNSRHFEEKNSISLSRMKSIVIWLQFQWRLLLLPNWKSSNTDSYLGLVLNSRQAIIRTIDGLINISLGMIMSSFKIRKTFEKEYHHCNPHVVIQLICQHRIPHVQFISQYSLDVALNFVGLLWIPSVYVWPIYRYSPRLIHSLWVPQHQWRYPERCGCMDQYPSKAKPNKALTSA